MQLPQLCGKLQRWKCFVFPGQHANAFLELNSNITFYLRVHLSPAVAPATATATASGVATKVWRMLMLTWSCPQNNKMILINFLLRNIPMLVFMRKLHILHECLWMCVYVLCMLSIKGIRNAIWGYVGNVRPSRSLPGSLYSSWVSPLGIQATAFVKRSLACDGLCVCVCECVS